jgi:glutathione peroxidase
MHKDFYKIEVEKATGEITTLEEYKGKVILIVNTASKCGYTPQLTGLQNLSNTFKKTPSSRILVMS